MSLKLKMCILIKSCKISHVFRPTLNVGIEGIDGCVDAWQRRDFSNRRVMPAFQPHWLAIGRAISRSLEVIGCARAFSESQSPGDWEFSAQCIDVKLRLKNERGSGSGLGSFPAFSDSTIRKQSNVLRVSNIGFGPERAASIPIG